MTNTQSPLDKQSLSWATPLIEALARGETVQTRPNGKSMDPVIPPKSLVTIVPASPATLSTKDVVLVTCKDNVYLHRIGAIVGFEYVVWFRIENASGRGNGWVTGDKIHGVVTRVEP